MGYISLAIYTQYRIMTKWKPVLRYLGQYHKTVPFGPCNIYNCCIPFMFYYKKGSIRLLEKLQELDNYKHIFSESAICYVHPVTDMHLTVFNYFHSTILIIFTFS